MSEKITVADVLRFLDSIAPQKDAMEWDNNGLLCGSLDKSVNRILVALDPFEEAAEEATVWGADLLVTHHPLIFTPMRSITDKDAAGRTIQKLLRSGISAVNVHTNLDVAPDGVNKALADVLELSEIKVINPIRTDTAGRQWGLLRKGTIQEQSLQEFLKHVKKRLGAPGLRYVDSGRNVSSVAVGGGACASEISGAVLAGCDTFVTSDVKYNQFWEAADQGINLIDAGHFYTEDPICAVLCAEISRRFPNITVRKSLKHKDCMKFFV